MTKENHEISITRHIAASPATVWTVMKERLPEWWCPKPWSTEVDAIDWRSGGRFDTTMRGPDGEVVANRGIFLEVLPERRLVFTDAVDGQWNPQEAFMIGIMEIEPEQGGTRYVARARHWSEAAKQRHLDMGFTDGWMAVADQLAELSESAD